MFSGNHSPLPSCQGAGDEARQRQTSGAGHDRSTVVALRQNLLEMRIDLGAILVGYMLCIRIVIELAGRLDWVIHVFCLLGNVWG